MHFTKLAAGLALALALAMAASGAVRAETVVLDCRVNAAIANGGLVQPQYMFQYQSGASEALVTDGLIQQKLGKPVTAKLRDEATRSTFSWGYNVSAGAAQVPLRFTGTLLKANNTFIITAKVTGGSYRGDGSAQGSCTRR